MGFIYLDFIKMVIGAPSFQHNQSIVIFPAKEKHKCSPLPLHFFFFFFCNYRTPYGKGKFLGLELDLKLNKCLKICKLSFCDMQFLQKTGHT